MRTRLLLPAVLLASAFVLTGCNDDSGTATPAPSSAPGVTAAPKTSAKGGSATSTATSSAPSATRPAGAVDPCTLVTKSDAETLAGTPLEDGQSIGDSCGYSPLPDGPTAQVEFWINETADNFGNQDKAEWDKVDGVGDEAYIEPDTYWIHFRNGDEWASIRLLRLDDDPKYREGLIALAKQVAPKL